jgi:hypothetical protein
MSERWEKNKPWTECRAYLAQAQPSPVDSARPDCKMDSYEPKRPFPVPTTLLTEKSSYDAANSISIRT